MSQKIEDMMVSIRDHTMMVSVWGAGSDWCASGLPTPLYSHAVSAPTSAHTWPATEPWPRSSGNQAQQ